jgi:YfiH family protein
MSDLWHWHTETAHPHLTTTLLKRWPHGFFTRASWPETPESLSQRLDSAAKMYRAKQVHGNRVLSPSDFPLGGSEAAATLPEADAVMTLAPQQAAWVCTADCTPVLIADEETGQVAAVHAGWRGTALRVVPETVQQMQSQGSDLQNLRVAIGPAIAGKVYQVTTHVAAEVGRSLPVPVTDDEALLAHLQAIEPPPLLPDEEPGRIRLDVPRINVLQLLALGLEPDQIAIAPHCTYQEPDKFFSYRRTREKKVQWSGIVSR